MKRSYFLFQFLFSVVISYNTLFAQDYGYFIAFTDKANSQYSITSPEKFLSARAIERRAKQNISITEEDLPVNSEYVDSLKKLGILISHTTKWLNGAIAFSNDAALMDTLTNIHFISTVELTKSPITLKNSNNKLNLQKNKLEISSYGSAWNQTQTLNVHHLHQAGYKGEGMHIAVIDAGFYKANELPVFEHLWSNGQILGSRDFVNPQSNIFKEHAHGMMVLSTMGGYIDNTFSGTAPEASYWLLRSEDAASEFPIEGDYWILAAEFADSAGVDIINTSLGYNQFDNPSFNYSYDELNGETLRISRAADLAASKGMLIIISAGNEGSNPWKYITAPADAKNVISVGAIRSDSIRASFSGFGPSADDRIKPDLSAMGYNTTIQDINGELSHASGTSFSAPILSGSAACFWQANPNLSATEIRNKLIESAHLHSNPNNELGYGIPNFKTLISSYISLTQTTNFRITPNPFKHQIVINGLDTLESSTIYIHDLLGNLLKIILHESGQPSKTISNLDDFQVGCYVISIVNHKHQKQFKLIKY